MFPRGKACVRTLYKVTGRLTECPSVPEPALRPWRLVAPTGPWAANRPIAPHYAPSGYIRLDRPNSNCNPTHARGERHHYIGESLRELRWRVRPFLPPLFGPPLLPHYLRGLLLTDNGVQPRRP